MKSRILVFVQFFLIFLMLMPYSDFSSFKVAGFFFVILGIVVGLLGIKEHPKDNFNIRPDIKESCILITDGVYKYIRHPMYFSVIVSMLGVLLLKFSFLELVLYIFLVINMVIKMLYEESLWHCDRDEYKKYAKSTKRLIPYIF